MGSAWRITPGPRRPCGQRGQALAEFAMSMPLLVMILFAVFQFGTVFVNYIEVSAAAREGARRATVSRSSATGVADAQAAARNAAWLADETQLGVVVTPQPWRAGQEITITVTYPYRLGIPGLAVQSGTLRSSLVARVE